MNLEAFGQAPCVDGWMAVATIQIVDFSLNLFQDMVKNK